MKERVEAALSKIRPMLMGDGGGVELVGVEGKVVKVRLTGACGCCPGAMYTLKGLVEQVVRTEVPEVESVEAVP